MQPKSGKTQENDELTIVKGLILSRELELLHLNNNILRLQERSQILEDRCQEIIAKGKEKEDTLKQNVALLTRLKELLEKESEAHEVARRLGVQALTEADEKLHREINTGIEETKEQMSNRTEELLHPLLRELKEIIQEIALIESSSAAEKVLKFLYACLDHDDELVQVAKSFKCSFHSNPLRAGTAPTFPNHIDSENQLRIFLSRALSLQATIQHFHGSAGERENKDIYGLRFDVANRQRPGTTEMPVSTCAQTDLMGLKWDASTIEEHQNCPSN